VRGKTGRLGIATLSNAVARGASMLVTFLTVPLVIGYLGPEEYGLWMTVTSLVLMLSSFADGGVSLGLISATANAKAKDGDSAVRGIIGSAAAILILVAIILIATSFAVVPFVPWQWVFNLRSAHLAGEASTTVLVIVMSVALASVANMILKVRIGLQQLPAVNAWDAAATISSIPALLLAMQMKLAMPWIAAASVGTPLLIKSIGSVLFLHRTPALMPTREDVNFVTARDLLARGSVFFLITLTQAIAIQSDQVLIARLADVEQVATYSVVWRLFNIPFLIANFFLLSLWPAFSDAAARGAYDWVSTVFWRTLWAVTGLGAVLSLALLAFHKPILAIWVGDRVKPDLLLVAGMTAYAVLAVMVGVCSVLLVSLDIRRLQIWINMLMVTVNVPLSIILIPKIGAAGAIIGTAVSYLLCMVLPYAVLIPRILKNNTSKSVISLQSRETPV